MAYHMYNNVIKIISFRFYFMTKYRQFVKSDDSLQKTVTKVQYGDMVNSFNATHFVHFILFLFFQYRQRINLFLVYNTNL